MQPVDVSAQLERIFAHPRFVASPQLKSFLRYTVEQSTAGNSKNIKAYTIATEALGRRASFNPDVDPIVRVQAGRLRKLLDSYYATDGASDPIRITIPKGSYIPEIERACANIGEAVPTLSGGCVVGRPLERPIIALFPCEPVYFEPWQQGFCEALSEELLNCLNRFQTVGTLSLASVLNAMRLSSDPRECGAQIGADFMLEGRFFSDGSTTRMLIKMIAVANGASVWSKAYDLDLTPDNKMALQQEMANEISAQIAEPFGYAHRDATWNSQHNEISELNAYQCVLQAHLYGINSSDQSFERALRAAQRAVDLLPDCGTAWATMSDLYCDGYRYGHNGLVITRDYLDRAEMAAKKAYQLCSECSVSSMAMAGVLFARGKTDEGRKMGETAIVQNPNDDAIKAKIGLYLASADEWQAGMELVKKAISNHPVELASYNHVLGRGHYIKGEYRSSLSAIDKTDACLPFFKHLGLAVNFANLDKKDDAKQAVSRLKEYWPEVDGGGVKRLLARSQSTRTVSRHLDSLRSVGMKI